MTDNRHSALYHHGGQFRQSETTLRHRPDIGTQLPQRDTATLFRHPHGKRRDTCRAATCRRRNGEETTKTTSIKKSCRFSTSELHRRRTLIPFQPKNTLFHAQRTENFSANSKPYRYTTFTGLSPVENSSH